MENELLAVLTWAHRTFCGMDEWMKQISEHFQDYFQRVFPSASGASQHRVYSCLLSKRKAIAKAKIHRMVSASIPVPMHRCQCNSIWGRKLKVFTSQLSSFSNTSICSTTWLLACSSAKNVGLLKMVVPSPLVSAPTQKNWRYKLLYCEVSICSSQHPTEYVREGVGGGVQIIWGFHVAPKSGWI